MALRRAMPLLRDSGGVVHLRAGPEPGLHRRLGYCHGHDRALQILLMRVLVSGRERLLVQMVQAGLPRGRIEEIFPGRLEGLDASLVRRVRLGERLVPGSVRWAAALPRALASSNWVIAPSRTRSGRAILASDPQLEVNRLPAVWYESVLELEDRFAITATIPGLPLLAIARTSDLAWAPTYGCMDMVDSWIEDCRDGRYRRIAACQERWEPFPTRTEVIRRKHHPDLTLTLYENDHGLLDGDPHQPGLYLATRWAGQGTGAATLAAGFALWRAANIAQGMDAVGRIESSWNWGLADSGGDIGYQHSGRMPVRRDGCSGLVPLPGWDPRNDWAGFAAPAELPRARNPQAGYLATANHLNHLGQRHPINLPMGQDRAIRIAEMLEQRRDWTLEDVREMQLDVYSKQAERFMAILRPLLPADGAAGVLREWDCRYDAGSRGAGLFERFYRELLLEVFGAACGPDVARYLLAETAVIPGLFSGFDRALLDERSGWLPADGRDAAFRRAAGRALTGPATRWSQHQQFTFSHLMLGGRLPRWLGFDRGPYSLPGGRATIRQGQIFRQTGRDTILGAVVPLQHRLRRSRRAHRPGRRPVGPPLLPLVRQRDPRLAGRADQTPRPTPNPDELTMPGSITAGATGTGAEETAGHHGRRPRLQAIGCPGSRHLALPDPKTRGSNTRATIDRRAPAPDASLPGTTPGETGTSQRHQRFSTLPLLPFSGNP